MRNLLYAIFIITALLCSCHRDPVWQTLDAAESMMEEHPDSALALLTTIEGRTLKGETQARYALLLSQAYDKNYIDVPNDSLASIALHYYTEHNQAYYAMLAEYYLAISNLNNKNYSQALILSLSTKRKAEELNELKYITLSEFLISRLYSHSYNEEGAAYYLTSALNHSRELNRLDWIGLAHYNFATLHLSRKNFTLAAQSLDSAMVYLPIDADLMELNLLILFGQEHFAKYDSIYQEYSSTFS